MSVSKGRKEREKGFDFFCMAMCETRETEETVCAVRERGVSVEIEERGVEKRRRQKKRENVCFHLHSNV